MTRATLTRIVFPLLAALSLPLQQLYLVQAPASASRCIPSFSQPQAAQPVSAQPVTEPSAAQSVEGPLIEPKIEVGPFDLHRRYRSMEGPYLTTRLRIGDLVASKRVWAPESMIVFVEGKESNAPGPSMGAPAAATPGQLQGLVRAGSGKRDLYWLKAMKLEVLDENDKPLNSAEFICHLNVDVDQSYRQRVFPEMEESPSGRILTLTQGQTEFGFPDGFAVPVASDETWSFTFQAANRTSDQHRRVKQLLTVSLIKDSDLVQPVKALSWYAPYVRVVVDRDTPESAEAEHKMGPSCLGTVPGVTAPNSVPGALLTDRLGRRLSGHWVVPPGVHTYASPVSEEWDPGFASKKRRVHAVWSHVHPLCTEVALSECKSGKDLFDIKVETKTEGGLELQHIDAISSKQGIVLQPGKHYQIKATYDNTTSTPQDSMIVLGMFFADEKFARPDWVLSDKNEAFCGVTAGGGQSASDQSGKKRSGRETSNCAGEDSVIAGAPAAPASDADATYWSQFPLFNPDRDGPLLSEEKFIALDTSLGKIYLVLDPTIAPYHATQMYKLLTKGAFNGTPISRFEPNFVLQVALAETKVRDDSKSSSESVLPLLRRLPLEVGAQFGGGTSHQKWNLTMARYNESDSATSSFSILLADAHHLDKQYTVFGHIVPDNVSVQTIARIEQQFNTKHPYIKAAVEIGPDEAKRMGVGASAPQR